MFIKSVLKCGFIVIGYPKYTYSGVYTVHILRGIHSTNTQTNTYGTKVELTVWYGPFNSVGQHAI